MLSAFNEELKKFLALRNISNEVANEQHSELNLQKPKQFNIIKELEITQGDNNSLGIALSAVIDDDYLEGLALIKIPEEEFDITNSDLRILGNKIIFID